MNSSILIENRSWWQRLTLRLKLQLGIAGFSLLILVICAASIGWSAHSYFHKAARQDIQMLAEVLADNSRAAVAFDDAAAATSVLAALKGNPHVVDAIIIRGRDIFATYKASEAPSELIAQFRPSPGVWLSGGYYYATVPIMLAQDIKGWLLLRSGLAEWENVKRNLYLVFSGLLAAVLLLMAATSYWLNRHITRPLSDLSGWAVQVSRAKDFGARAIKHNDDEIGHLADSLNRMLVELSRQETILSWNQMLENEIRERKEVEKRLIDMRNRAESASTAKSQFLANMSHELRTPLNAIIGYSEILQEGLQDNDIALSEIAADVTQIHKAGRHLLSVINDILDLSKIEAGKMDISVELLNVDVLLNEVIDTIRPLAQARENRLTLTKADELGFIRSDALKIRQVLLNLLSNAAKFTEHGQVAMHAARESDPAGDRILIQIRDTGIGMSPRALSTLFKPFSQADASMTRRFGGTGLGLAISRSYARALGGDIEVQSQEGQGSTFTVILPAQAARDDEQAGVPEDINLDDPDPDKPSPDEADLDAATADKPLIVRGRDTHNDN